MKREDANQLMEKEFKVQDEWLKTGSTLTSDIWLGKASLKNLVDFDLVDSFGLLSRF